MVGLQACLIDVYDTVLSCDFAAHRIVLPTLAGVPLETWNSKFLELAPAVSDGRLSMAAAYADVIRSSGAQPGYDLVDALVRRDQELLIHSAILHEDTVPFLKLLRSRGIQAAFVSNCGENTRPLLATLGLTDLVDAVVLSCEVGYAKPSAEIYLLALDRLGVTPDLAMLIDDQPDYCAGASALGIKAIRIDRRSTRTNEPGTVNSLREIETML